MSTFKVDVFSREMIKPSSPTPITKKVARLSLIDQLAANGSYIPILLFYHTNPSTNPSISNIERSSILLKQSLSDMLVDFYPLAGRVQGNELIDCTDEGVEFSEANSSENITTFLENNRSIDDLHELLPFQQLFTFEGCPPPRHKNIVLSVQVNHFACGGMAIGVCLHHKIADAASTIDFLRAWAAKTQDHVDNIRENGVSIEILRPDFSTGASLFPPLKVLNQVVLQPADQIAILTQKNLTARRLIFDKQAIKELKAQAIAANNNSITRPTRVEVVTAFIFKHWPTKVTAMMHVVNVRKRMEPRVPEDFFGNCVWYARTSEDPVEFRKAVEKISGNFMNELISSDDFLLRLKQETDALFERPDELLLCNGITGYPLYEVNFGMGKPFWTSLATRPVKNGVVLNNTKCGQGIEAWVCMLEEDVSKLDNSLSQLSYPVIKPMQMH